MCIFSAGIECCLEMMQNPLCTDCKKKNQQFPQQLLNLVANYKILCQVA